MNESLRGMFVAIVAGAVAFGATASAQEPDKEKPKVRPPTSVHFELDDQEIELKLQGDELSLELDGDSMPAERYKIEGDVCLLFDRFGGPIGRVMWSPEWIGVYFTERSNQAYLGVDLQLVPSALAEHLDLKLDKAAYVVGVSPGSPADRAGLEKHDVLLKFNGEPLANRELRQHLAKRKPGDEVTLTLLRRGEEQDIEVTLGRAPSPWVDTLGGNFFWQDLGLQPGGYTVDALRNFDNAFTRRDPDDARLWSTLLPYTRLQAPERDAQEKDHREHVAEQAEALREQVERLEQRLRELEELIRSLRDKRDG